MGKATAIQPEKQLKPAPHKPEWQLDDWCMTSGELFLSTRRVEKNSPPLFGAKSGKLLTYFRCRSRKPILLKMRRLWGIWLWGYKVCQCAMFAAVNSFMITCQVRNDNADNMRQLAAWNCRVHDKHRQQQIWWFSVVVCCHGRWWSCL